MKKIIAAIMIIFGFMDLFIISPIIEKFLPIIYLTYNYNNYFHEQKTMQLGNGCRRNLREIP